MARATRWRPLLRHPSDRRSVGAIALYYACLAVLWRHDARLLAAGVPGALLCLGVYAAQLLLAAVAAVVSHNALHVPVFHSALLQRLLQLALTGCYGQPASVYQPMHNRGHHRHTGTRRDPMRPTKLRYEWNALNMLLAKEHCPGFAAGLRLVVRFYATQWRARPALVRTCLCELAFVAALALGAVAAAPRKGVMYVLLPQQVGQWFINCINYLQHDGCDVDPRHEGFNHSRNFTGPVFNYVFFNNGYHTIHHMFPGLHWSALPAQHATAVRPHIHPALEQPCFRRYACGCLFARHDYLGRPVALRDGADEDILLDALVNATSAERKAH